MQPAPKLNPDTRDWIPIERVAELTGLTPQAWRFRAPKLEARGEACRLVTGNSPPKWHFRRSVDPRLGYRRREGEDAIAVRALSGDFAEKDVKRAQRKLHWVKRYRDACGDARFRKSKREVAAEIVTEAKAAEGEGFRISVRSLEAWDRAYRDGGVDRLIDRYAGGERDARRSDEAVRLFYTVYHTEQRLSVQQCHDVVRDEARRNGWRWSASVSATRRWLDAHDNREITLLMRDGPEAYTHRAMPHVTQDYASVPPGKMVVCDHHQFKHFVNYRGKAIRPWLTAIMDCFSRVVVGWHVTPSPNSASIMSALRSAFIDWGVPETVKIDNGRDFTAKAFTGVTKHQARSLRRKWGKAWAAVVRKERDRVHTAGDASWFGILPELGCRVIYATPYAGWSKHVERWFRTLTDRHSRTRPGFCDTSPHLKPSGLKEIVADVRNLPSIDEEVSAMRDTIDLYHARPHGGDGMNGMTPREAWASKPSVVRIAPDGALDLLTSVRGVYRVGANGVAVTVAGERFGYGQYDVKLRSYFDKKVLVAIDPQRMDQAVIMTAESGEDRRVICRVTRNKAVSPAADTSETDLREAVADMKRSRREMHKAARSSATRMMTASQIVEKNRRRRAIELRATGTTGKPAPHPDQTLRVIQTGIDADSIDHRSAVDADDASPAFEPWKAFDCDDEAPSRTAENTFDPSCLVDDEGEGQEVKEDFAPWDMVGGDEDPVDDRPSIEDLL